MAFSIFILGFLLAGLGTSVRAEQSNQMPTTQVTSDNQVPVSLPLDSPAIAEIAHRTQPQFVSRDVPSEIREARAAHQSRESLEATADAFRELAAEHKQDLSVTLANHKRITGRVLAADGSTFTIRARYMRHESTFRYSEIIQWRVVPSAGNQALQIIALVLLTIPLISLAFLAGLAGWDGC